MTTVLDAIRASDDLRISLEKAAATAFLSPSRFAHLFKEQVDRRLKTIYPIVLAALVTLGLHALYTGQALHAANRTWTGEISSSNCGLTHTPGMPAGECTRECVDHGAAYVLVSNGKVYTFANQADKERRAHAGEIVTVTGELKGEVIAASRIEGAASTGTRQ